MAPSTTTERRKEAAAPEAPPPPPPPPSLSVSSSTTPPLLPTPAPSALNAAPSSLSSGGAGAGAGGSGTATTTTTTTLGDATGVTLLLSNHAAFGLAERVCYHFDLIETLTATPLGGGSITSGGSVEQATKGGRPSSSTVPATAGKDGEGGDDDDGGDGGADRRRVAPPPEEEDDPRTSSRNQWRLGRHPYPSGVVSLLECCAQPPPAAQPQQPGGGPSSSSQTLSPQSSAIGGGSGGGAGGGSGGGLGGGGVGGSSVVRQAKRLRRLLRNRHREFNLRARLARAGSGAGGAAGGDGTRGTAGDYAATTPGLRCYQPRPLPLAVQPGTRVSFAYELTCVALVLDASPSITSTFGNLGSGWSDDEDFDVVLGDEKKDDGGQIDDEEEGAVCCPLDRLGPMVRRYLNGLVAPISGVPPSSASKEGSWKPELAVTVLAAYPRRRGGGGGGGGSSGDQEGHGSGNDNDDDAATSLLVRDFRVTDAASANRLADAVHRWATVEVEDEIASRLASAPYSSVATTVATSSLRDVLDAADAALLGLPPEGRPTVVFATDCRSVSCGAGVMESATDPTIRRTDVPVHVLDLSSPRSHRSRSSWRHIPPPLPQMRKFQMERDGAQHDGVEEEEVAAAKTAVPDRGQPRYLTFDNDGPYSFPLQLSDDSGTLFDASRATGGSFYDGELLREAVRAVAGQVPPGSALHGDYYLSFKRRTLRPNALQWYTLFSLSPFTPQSSGSWGRLPPPKHLRGYHQGFGGGRAEPPKGDPSLAPSSLAMRKTSISSTQARDSLGNSLHSVSVPARDVAAESMSHGQLRSAPGTERTVFSTYSLSPVRIKGILMMRVLEGYRAKRYGSNTQDSDKVSVHFTLPLDYGTVLHYEIYYVASPYHNPFVGSAHVKLELSGDPAFVQMVKNEFISHQVNARMARPATIARAVSAKLCKFLRWIRKEDCLESYLCPLDWGEKLSAGSPFIRRLGTLSTLQRYRHFRNECFEVVLVGGEPYGGNEGLLSEFLEADHGEEELFECVCAWSTQVVSEERIYVKQLSSTQDDLTFYCIVETIKSDAVARLFTISIDFYGELGAGERLQVVYSLQEVLCQCKDVVVMPKNLSSYLTLQPKTSVVDSFDANRARWIEKFYHHKSWELIKDKELLPLLVKRRNQKGNFWLLDSGPSQAVFAKFVYNEGQGLGESTFASNLYLVQYMVHSHEDQLTVDIHMESPRGFLSPLGTYQQSPMFLHRIYERVKRRDQECGRALRSRTSLLSVFDMKTNSIVKLTNATPEEQAKDVKRLLSYSSCVRRNLRFFRPGTGSANTILADMTCSLMVSGTLDVKVARLSIGSSVSIGDVGPGVWFLISHDWYSLSMVHFASFENSEVAEERDSSPQTHRQLTFFTVGINDLYHSKDETAEEDDSTAGGTSEHVAVTEVADVIESGHGKNYARAAYLALRESQEVFSQFDPDDLSYALAFCSSTKILDAYVLEEPSSSPESFAMSTGSKLLALVKSLLSPVPGGDGLYFYYSGGDEDTPVPEDAIESKRRLITDEFGSPTLGGESYLGDDYNGETPQEDFHSDFMLTPSTEGDNESQVGDSHLFTKTSEGCSVPPPLFVSFTLDGKPASASDLLNLEKSSSLSAFITIFGGPRELIDVNDLPKGHHRAVAYNLKSSLNSFASEQTLERLRHVGPSISEVDVKTVMDCLLQTRSLASRLVSVEFFVPKIDCVILASCPTGSSESDLNHGFSLLAGEIEKQEAIRLKRTRQGAFFVAEEDSSGGESLPFWCFVQVQRSRGIVMINAFHPSGKQAAEEVTERVYSLITRVCHRVNQIMLLERLHQTKVASRFLIVDPSEATTSDAAPLQESGVIQHSPGHFECPLKFFTCFPLYHRCVPSQAIMSLDGVLHNFSVSNRRGFFVYKDEENNIFYMTFTRHRKTDLVDGEPYPYGVELRVYGVQEPGPSITQQLKRLLHRRLVTISVDALSNVLTKNPLFQLLPADTAFIHTFEEMWSELKDDNASSDDHERIYEFPPGIQDPVMVLLLFRQNIGGSTFFHRLHEVLHDHEEKTALSVPNLEANVEGIQVAFQPREFSLFFNNCPSQLDPTFQALSTLTDQGKKYSQQTGVGVAIVEINLLQRDNKPVEQIMVGLPPQLGEVSLSFPHPPVNFKRVGSNVPDGRNYRLHVRLTNTTLNLSVLHSWIEMSLNQVLTAWCIERHLKLSKLGLLVQCKQEGGIGNQGESGAGTVADKKLASLNELCCGLPSFQSMLKNAYDLPHPAAKRFDLTGPLKASSLARLTLEALEKAILAPIFANQKQHTIFDCACVGIIHSSGLGRKPTFVNLLRRSSSSDVLIESTTGRRLRDGPTSSPEYICVFGIQAIESGKPESSQKRRLSANPNSSALLFKEVAVEKAGADNATEFSRVMAALKSSNAPLFSRNLAFILTINRHSRSLLTYNWNPQCFAIAKERLADIEDEVISVERQALQRQQSRCLPFAHFGSQLDSMAKGRPVNVTKTETITPPPNAGNRETALAQQGSTPATKEGEKEIEKPSTRPTRRIPRPTKILRPKLIGKSVEGAAMQAVAASRARASARPTSHRKPASGSSTATLKGRREKTKDTTNASKNAIEKNSHVSKKETVALQKRLPNSADHVKQDRTESARDTLPASILLGYQTLVKGYPHSLNHSKPPWNVLSFLANDWLNEISSKQPTNLGSIRLMASFATKLRSVSCRLFKCPNNQMNSFPRFFAESLIERGLGTCVVSTDTPDDRTLRANAKISLSTVLQGDAIFLRQDVLTKCKSCRAIMILEVSVATHPFTRLQIGHCRGWLFIGQSRREKSPSKRNKIALARLERVISLVDTLATCFCDRLHMESEAFNFAGTLLKVAVRQPQGNAQRSLVTTILRQMNSRYPLPRQRRLPNLKYRLLRRSLRLDSFLCDKHMSSWEASELFRYMCEHASLFDLQECSGKSGICLARKVDRTEIPAYLFLVPAGPSFCLDVLCSTRGKFLDGYVVKDGYAETLSNLIIFAAEDLARMILRSAATRLRRDTLWKKVGPEFKEGTCSLADIHELCEMSTTAPVAGTDPRLSTIISDKQDDLGIDWGSLVHAMGRDSSFSSCVAISDPALNGLTVHLFYFKEGDAFLIFKVGSEGSLKDLDMLTKEDTESKALINKRERIIEMFINWVLHWMWSSL